LLDSDASYSDKLSELHLLVEAFVLLTPISTTPPAGGCAQYDVSLSHAFAEA